MKWVFGISGATYATVEVGVLDATDGMGFSGATNEAGFCDACGS